MRKLATLSLSLFVFLGLFLTSLETQASHLKGCDLTYQCVDHPDSNKYLITATLYRDCDGINMPAQITVAINSASCGITNQTFQFQRVNTCPFPGIVTATTPNFVCEVTPVCPDYIDSSCCTSNSPTCIPGTQMFIYADTIQFPQRCNDWIISTSQNARNASITNLVNPQQSLYCEALMNNLDYPCNNSPFFTNFPVPYICLGQQFSYNQGAVDIDGDSIAYVMTTPRSAVATNMTFANGLNVDSFIVSSDPVTLDNVTGQLTFTPSTQPQEAVSAIKVYHYVNGDTAGYVIRDMQWNVVDSSLCSGVNGKSWHIEQTSVANGLWVDSFRVLTCPEDSISFTVTITGDSLSPFSNFDLVFPGGQKDSVVFGQDSIRYSFGWKPGPFDTGVYVFNITSVNVTCPLQEINTYPYVLEVGNGTYAGEDQFYCLAGGASPVRATGGTAFQWVVLPDGFNTWTAAELDTIFNFGRTDTAYIAVTPLERFPYYIDLEVTSNLASCKNKDTVRISWVPTFFDNVTATPDTICKFDTSRLFAGLDPVNGPLWAPYTYSWKEMNASGGLVDPVTFWPDSVDQDSIQDPVAQPLETTTYVVTIVSDTGCRVTDTVTIVVAGEQPQVDTLWGYPVVCAGDSVQLEIVTCEGNNVFDDFNTGPDITQWNTINGGVAINQCSPSPAGGTAMWFNAANNRNATTNAFNTTRGGSISFWFAMGNSSFGACNWPDATDTIMLEYSLNGTTWIPIQVFLGADRVANNYSTWQQYTYPIPQAAWSSSTQFRIRQGGAFFTNGDVWAIDDFTIDCCGSFCSTYQYTWSPAGGLSATNIPNPWINPSSTTTYNVNIVPIGTDCDLDYPVTVTVAQQYNYTLTQNADSICKGYAVDLELLLPDAAQGPYTVIWSGSGTVIGAGGNCVPIQSGSTVTGTGAMLNVFPCETSTWYFDIYSDSGCYKRDSLTITVVGATPQIDSVIGYPIACEGECVQFFIATGNLLFDDFESGAPNPNIWDNVTTATTGAGGCGSLDGSSNNLYMNGPTTGRFVQTLPLDLSFNCQVCFDFILGGPGTPCEDADAALEYVDFEYSIDGGASWVVINNFPTGVGAAFTPWANYCFSIPAAAQTSSTILRLNQPQSSGPGFDNWALDNFLIDCSGGNDSLEYCWWVDTIPPPCLSDSSFVQYCPTEDTSWLKYSVANPGGFCPIIDSIQIFLVDNFTWTSTQSKDTICKGEQVLFTFNFDSVALGPYDIVWTSSGTVINLDSACIANETGSITGVVDTASVVVSPCATTYYYFSHTSDEGCRNYDTLIVYVAGELPRVAGVVGDTGICIGESVELYLELEQVDFCEDCDSSQPGLFDNIQNGSCNPSCSTPDGSANALHFSGPFGQERSVSTIPLDVTGACSFTFDINVPLLSNGGCNSPETGEDVSLEYSIDGGVTWVNIATYTEQNAWQNISVTIPAGARSGSTQFRWIQNGSPGTNIDNWALDNVCIQCAGMNDSLLEYTWVVDGATLDTTIQYTGSGSVVLSPGDDEYFIYTVTQPNGFCPLTDSVLVKVGNFFGNRITQNDDSICKGNVLLITLDSLDASEGPYDITWYPASLDGDLDIFDSACMVNSSGFINTGTGVSLVLTPCESQYYIFEMVSANGCKIIDSAFIYVAGETPDLQGVIGYPIACQGNEVSLDLLIGGTTTEGDNFNNGAFDPVTWGNVQNGQVGNLCPGTLDNSAGALVFNLGPTSVTRQATTNPLDLSNNCQLVFDFFAADFTGACEALDNNEHVILEFSNNLGGTWTQITTYGRFAPGALNIVNGWNTFIVNLPPAAQTSSTLLRWRQNQYTVPTGDVWALDNVQFLCDKDTGLEYFWWVDSLGQTVQPLLDTSQFTTGTGTFTFLLNSSDWVGYTVSQPGGFCPYTDSIFVSVVPDFNYSITASIDTICKNQSTNLIVDLDTTVGSYYIEWFAGGATIGPGCNSTESDTGSVFGAPHQYTATVQPCNTTTYYFTIFSDSGCRKLDSITIYVAGESPIVDIVAYNIVCEGDSLQLDMNTCVGNSLADDFDAGFTPYWDSRSPGVKIDNLCGGPSPQGNDFLIMHPTEDITSIPLDLVGGGNLTFYVRKGTGFTVDCGDPDFNENLFVEYSIDTGGTWITLGAPAPYLEGDVSLETWTQTSIPIPPAASTSYTLLRFRIGGTFASTTDAWHIDDVLIQCCDPSCETYDYTWTPNTAINTDTSRMPFVKPLVTTTYSVLVAPSGTQCTSTDSITIFVAPDFTWSLSASDDTICKFDSTFLTLHLDSSIASYTVDWSSSSTFNSAGCDNEASGSQTTSGPLTIGISPCKTTTYYFEMTSDSGCKHFDTLTIVVSGQNPRVLNVSIDPICQGDTAYPEIEICGFDLLTDDLTDTSQWDPDSLINVNFVTGACTPPPSGTNFILFNVGGNGTRIITQPLNLASATSISFWYWEGQGGFSTPCGNPDFNEDLELVYLPPAGFTWLPFPTPVSYDRQDQNDNTWIFQNIPLPPQVQVNGTRLAFRVTGTPTSNDVWALDDILIECCDTIGSCASFDFLWTGTSDATSNNAISPGFFPSQNTELVLQSSLQGTDCIAFDTVTLEVGYKFNFTASNDTSVCRYADVPLFVNPDAGSGPYDISWFPNDILNTGSGTNVIAQPNDTTTFTVVMTSDSGCVQEEEITVNIQGEIPLLSTAPFDTTICPGTGVGLETTVEQRCGTNGHSPTGSPIFMTPAGGGAANNNSPFLDNTEVRYQMLFEAADLQARGLTAGYLANMTLQFGGPLNNDTAFAGFIVKMGCTNVSSLSGGFQSVTDVVFRDSLYIPPIVANSWTLPFDNLYDWDGQSNLVVEICYNNFGRPWHTGPTPIMTTAKAGNWIAYAERGPTLVCFECCRQATPTATPAGIVPLVDFFAWNPPTISNVNWTANNPSATVTPSNSFTPTATVVDTTQFVVEVDDNGCIAYDTVTVNVVPDTFNVSQSADTICIGDTFDITVYTEAPAAYNWTGDVGSLSSTTSGTPRAWPTVSSQYILELNIGNGCVKFDTVDIFVRPNETVTISTTKSPLCNFGELDSIVATVASGNPITAYDWQPSGQTTTALLTAAFGPHTLTATINGCQYTSNAVSPTVQTIQDSVPGDTVCNWETVTLQPLSPPGQYTGYTWRDASGNIVGTNRILSYTVDTATVTFTLTVDSGGCSYQAGSAATVVVRQSLEQGISATGPTVGCPEDGPIQLNAFPGNPPYVSFTWMPGAAVTPTNTFDAPNNGTTTTYYYIAQTAEGCFDTSRTIDVTFKAQPPVVVDTQRICLGDLTPVNWTAPAGYDNYSWRTYPGNVFLQNGNTFSWNSGTEINLMVLGDDTTGGVPCNDTLAIYSIVASGRTTYSLSASPDSACEGETIELTFTGSGNPASYVWMPMDIQTTAPNLSYTAGANGLTPGQNPHNIWVQPIPYDPNCEDVDSSYQIFIFENPVAEIDGGDSISILPDTLTLFEVGLDQTNRNWSWNLLDSAVNAAGTNTNFTYTFNGTQFVEVVKTNSGYALCADRDTIQVIVVQNLNIIIPNSFTPNGDGINDIFGPVNGANPLAGVDVSLINNMQIFDRWGNQVFNASNMGWDGTNASGQQVPNGTYVYYFVISNPGAGQGATIVQTGTVTLVR